MRDRLWVFRGLTRHGAGEGMKSGQGFRKWPLIGGLLSLGLLAGGIGLYAAPGGKVKRAALNREGPVVKADYTGAPTVQGHVVQPIGKAATPPSGLATGASGLATGEREERVAARRNKRLEDIPTALLADSGRAGRVVSLTPSPGNGGGGTANAVYSCGFEVAEGFTDAGMVGPMLIVGQVEGPPDGGLWCRGGFPGCDPGLRVDPASLVDPSVSDANPLTGAQHLRMAGDPAFPAPAPASGFLRAISPIQVVASQVAETVVTVWIFITNDLGADYHVRPTSSTQGFVSSYVIFHFDELSAAEGVPDADMDAPDLVVLDDPPGPPVTDFYATGTEWAIAEWRRLTIHSNPATNTILYYYDAGGPLGAPIWTGTVFSATTVEEVQFRSDNFQLPFEAGDVDDISFSVKPIPGACCTGAVCMETLQDACPDPSVWQGPGTTCTPVNPCLTGACCSGAGQVCMESVAAGDCMDPGEVFIPGADCSPNCCEVPVASQSGTDDCMGQAPVRIDVPGTRVYTGNNSMAGMMVSPDSCEAQFAGSCGPPDVDANVCDDNGDCEPGSMCIPDPLWWESFTINVCADVTIDFCCSPLLSPVYAVLYPGCPCVDGAGIVATDFAGSFGGGLPDICPDGNFHAVWEDLPPGTYYVPIYSNFDALSLGAYQMHVTTVPAGMGRCCNTDLTCTLNVCRSICENAGGTYGGDASVCFPPGVCGTGACCTGGACADGVAAGMCAAANQQFSGGLMCADVLPCPPANDNCAKAIPIAAGCTMFDSSGATTDGPDVTGSCKSATTIEDDIWYTTTATCNGDMTVSLCDDNGCMPTAAHDAVLAIYDGTACPPTMILGCGDDTCGLVGGPPTVTVPVTCNQEYTIQVGGFALGEAGPGSLSIVTVCAVGVPVCGNGCLEPGEGCDDGNTTACDGCSPTCGIETNVCGNGCVGPGEECDDGNTMSGDGCDSMCQSEGVPCTTDVDCVLADADVCTCDECVGGLCVNTPVEYGDANCSGGAPDLDDILCVLDGFANFSACPNGDVHPPCTGNNGIGLDDILFTIDAFAGIDPCGCP